MGIENLEQPQKASEEQIKSTEESGNPVEEYRNNLASKLKGIEDHSQRIKVLEEEKESSSYGKSEKIHRKGLEITDIKEVPTKDDFQGIEANLNGKEVKVVFRSRDNISATYDGQRLNAENARKIGQILNEASVVQGSKERDFSRLDELIANTEIEDLLI